MARSVLSEKDFQSLQENLIELKSRNYTLEEYARKAKHEIGDNQARIKVLEEALSKANKAVERSKKAAEVMHLMKENNLLQDKLTFQEEQSRLQNETLMLELSKLVKDNEKLEAQLKSKSSSQSDNIDRSQTSDVHESHIRELESKIAHLELKLSKYESSNSNDNMKKDQDQKSENPQTVPSESSNGAEAVIQQQKQKIQTLELQYGKEQEHLKHRVTELQNSIQDLEKKLQESSNTATHAVSDLEKKTIEYDNYKLQYPPEKFQQLEASRICLTDENQDLKEKLASACGKSSSIAASLGQAESKMEHLQEELDLAKKRDSERDEEMATLKKTSESRKALIDEMALQSQKSQDEFQTNLAGVKHKAEEMEKELKANLDARDKESESLKVSVNKKTHEIEKLKSKLSTAEDEIETLKAQIKELEARLSSKESELTDLAKSFDLEREAHKEALERDTNAVRAELDEKVGSLNTQLELTNVQIAEFEEIIAKLKQEIKDGQEEKKIVEKKGHGLMKDLKKQLEREKKRNEKLQEKIKDGCPLDVVSNGSESARDIDPDRSSISSWSIMSGQAERDRDVATPFQVSPISDPVSDEAGGFLAPTNDPSFSRSPLREVRDMPVTSAASTMSTTSGSASQELSSCLQKDNDLLLQKVASLQEDKWKLEERLLMLEQSSSAMADELFRKSELIQFYCMDSRTRQVRSSSTAATSAATHGGTDRGHRNSESGSTGKGLSLLGAQGGGVASERVRALVGKLVQHASQDSNAQSAEVARMQAMLEETLTKNMHLQENLEQLSQEVVRLSKEAARAPQTVNPSQESVQ